MVPKRTILGRGLVTSNKTWPDDISVGGWTFCEEPKLKKWIGKKVRIVVEEDK